jgi:DNA polymerase-3 subunit epsilon
MNFTSFDFETAKGKYACSLGLAKFRNGQLVDSRYYLINPEIDDWNFMAMKIHGIKPKDVLSSPNFKSLSDEIFEFIGDDSLIAHNCSFDYSVLEFSSGLSMNDLNNYFYCTLNFSRLVLHC